MDETIETVHVEATRLPPLWLYLAGGLLIGFVVTRALRL